MKLRPAILLTFVLPLAAFQDTDSTPTKPGRERVREFDIRAESRTGDAPARAVTSRREQSTRDFIRQPGGGRSDWRVSLNEFGLPKSVSATRGTLTAPRTAPAEQISRDFLRTNRGLFQLSDAEVAALRLFHKEERDGVTYLRFKQTLNDVDVFEGQVRATVDRQGRVVDAGVGEVIPGLSVSTRASLDPEAAVVAAFGLLDLHAPAELRRQQGSFERQVRFINPIGAQLNAVTVEPAIFPSSAESAVLAYRILVEVDSKGSYEMVIDAHKGGLLFLQNLYRNAASGRVWKESPIKGNRVMVDFPDSWLAGQTTPGVTTGNNVDAYLDADGNNVPDPTSNANMKSGRAFNADQVFDFSAGDRNTEQSPKDFQPAAVTSLFYFVNLAHDYYYSLGFDEAAGNFQKSNFGKGGKENDAINVQAQDGASNNNASFASTPDGTPPRMHVGLFTYGLAATAASNWADSDFDGQVLFHEYGHGVTNRIVGAGADTSCLSGTQSRALGEGWSDYFAISYFNNPVAGSYVGIDPFRGIRRNSYERYPYTYEDLGNQGFEPHNDGEIWAATLWDLRKQLGQEVTDKLVVAGLHSTPCRPSMSDARDGILAADAISGGTNRAAIWQVFARHGLGNSASGLDGFTRQGTVFTAAYDVPSDLSTGNRSPMVVSHALPKGVMGQNFSYALDATDPDGGTLAYQLVKGPDGFTVDSANGVVQWTAGFLSAPVQIAVTDGQGGRVVSGFYLYVETPLKAGSPTRVAGQEATTGYATIVVPENTPYLQATLRGGVGDADLWLSDPRGVYIGASLRTGNTETLTIPAPLPGVWGVEVDGYRPYSDLTLLAATPTPVNLTFPAVTLTNLSGDFTSETIYKVAVPAGEPSLTVSTAGGTGDVDLYIRRAIVGCSSGAAELTPCKYDVLSNATGNTESLSVTVTSAADYYIDVRGFAAYAGVTLKLTGAPTVVAAPASLSFSFTSGGTVPAAQNIAVTERAGGTLSWSASATTVPSGTWLKIAPVSGTQATPLVVSVAPAGLAAGTYTGAVIVTSTVRGSPISIPVTLKVQ